MINLIKCELYRFFKSKYTLIASILAVSFAIIVTLLNYFLNIAVTKITGEQIINRETFSALTSMTGALNPGSLFGYILAIFTAILLALDFRNGTIRTKIICGISKSKIHFVNYVASLIFIVALSFGYGILTLLFSFILYNPVPVGAEVGLYIGNFFVTLLFDLFSYVFVASVVLLLVLLIRTQGLSAFLYIVLIIGFQFVGGIFENIIKAIKLYETNMDGIITFLNVLNWINPFYLMGKLSTDYYSTDLIIANILSPLLWAIANYFLGYLAFVKKDIK